MIQEANYMIGLNWFSGVIAVLLGGLWVFQGIGIVHLRPAARN